MNHKDIGGRIEATDDVEVSWVANCMESFSSFMPGPGRLP